MVLLTLAIVDDIGAIAVIAIFYTSNIDAGWLAAGGGLLFLVLVLQKAQVWYTPIYMAIGICAWYAVLESGVHATIAGVALGLLTPATPLQREVRPDEVVGTVIDPDDLSAASARRASLYVRESVSVAERMENLIHPFSSFVILPIFALANAGVELSGEGISNAATSSVTLGILLGLVVGKTVGVSVFAWIAVRSGLSVLPRSVTWPMVVAVAMLAGIGFTVALFITGWAFEGDELTLLDTNGRIGILVASFVASVGGLTLLARATRAEPELAAPAAEPTPAVAAAD